MDIKNTLIPNTIILKSHVHRYTFFGLLLAFTSICLASCIVSYQLTGAVDLDGFILAQKTNPAIWILDLTPFMFVYWGQAFCEGLINKAQSILTVKTDEFVKISNTLELKLKHASNHDSLTQLPNSRRFNEQISSAIKQLGTDAQLAVILVKIIDFEEIISKYGTYYAHNVLKQFAQKLNFILVEPHMLNACTGLSNVFYLQGEEFAFLLPRLKPDFNADELLAKLHQSMIAHFVIDGIDINLSTTSGMAIFPGHGDEEGVVVSHALAALGHAKKQGVPFLIYNSEMEDDYTQNRNIMEELKYSIDNNNLDIFFQPVVELATGTIVGAESLARFEHSQFGLLTADKFIPLIEGTPLMKQLSVFMLTTVIKQLAIWHNAGYKLHISVNLSIQDACDRKLPAFIKRLLAESNLAPEFLRLEFNERACLTDQTVTKKVFEQLSNLGVKLSIDNFCSGYSSFLYLLNFPINDVKIEKSHVLGMIKDPKKAKVVEAIIRLTEVLQLETVADGIADKATMEKLVELGCVYGQGFYYSQAVDTAQFIKYLNKNASNAIFQGKHFANSARDLRG